MSPCVVLAEKLGATLPSRNRGCSSVVVANARLRQGEVEGQKEREERFRAFHDRGAGRVRNDAIIEGYGGQASVVRRSAPKVLDTLRA